MSTNLKANTKTKITSFEDAQKALQELQKKYNMLVDRILSPAEKTLEETEGQTGDIQVSRNIDKTYTFEVRTEDGWKTPVLGDSIIHFKSKEKTNAKNTKKSIEQIETEDTASGNNLANKTIFDEKNKKFILPRPDYDSGCVIWNWSDAQLLEDSALVLTHNLGVLPYECRVWFAPDGSLNGGTAMPAGRNNPTISGSHGDSVSSDIIKWAIPIPATFGSDHDFGIGVGIETDQASIIGGTGGDYGSISIKSAAFNGSGDYANYVDGYIRVLLWK